MGTKQFLTSQGSLYQFCADGNLTTQTNPIMMAPDAHNCIPCSDINLLLKSPSQPEGLSIPRSSGLHPLESLHHNMLDKAGTQASLLPRRSLPRWWSREI